MVKKLTRFKESDFAVGGARKVKLLPINLVNSHFKMRYFATSYSPYIGPRVAFRLFRAFNAVKA